jgi:hypothetical protein
MVLSESINRRRRDNTLAKSKRTNNDLQITIVTLSAHQIYFWHWNIENVHDFNGNFATSKNTLIVTIYFNITYGLYKQVGGKDKPRTSFLCGIRSGHHNTLLRTKRPKTGQNVGHHYT